MPKFNFHMGVTLRCYGNVEIEAENIEAAMQAMTADYLAENIEITETTTDSGQDLAVIDVSEAETGEDIESYAGHPLPSPYDPTPDKALLDAIEAEIAGMDDDDANACAGISRIVEKFRKEGR